MRQTWCYHSKHLVLLYFVRFIKPINFNIRAGYEVSSLFFKENKKLYLVKGRVGIYVCGSARGEDDDALSVC